MDYDTITIPKYQFSEPRFNLPRQTTKGSSPESRFTLAFGKAYQRQFREIHARSNKDTLAIVREIPVNGYGITDMLAVSWQGIAGETFPSSDAFAVVARPTCRAFEMKLSHWQKALSQAFRYRNFAHQAIVVVPPSVAGNARPMLDTFKKLRVGLWSFDMDTMRIVPIYTPRPHIPLSNRYWLQSIEKAAKTPNTTLPICGKG